MVSDQIAEMKESGSYSLQDIEKAKERYNSLTDDQKKQVKNYADLLKMEDAYEDAVADSTVHILGTEFLWPDNVISIKSTGEIEDLGSGTRYKREYDHALKIYCNGGPDASQASMDYFNEYLRYNFKVADDNVNWIDSRGNKLESNYDHCGTDRACTYGDDFFTIYVKLAD